jgi:hypothetical protein
MLIRASSSKWVLMACVASSAACAAGGDARTRPDDDGATSAGQGGASSSNSSVTATSSSVGAGGMESDGPLGVYGPDDMPPFTNAEELCAFVNSERVSYQAHERFRGLPWSGEYHSQVTWPLELTVDPGLMDAADEEAAALASGKNPDGSPFSDGAPPPHQYLFVAGVSSSAYTISTEELAGDWTADLVGNITAGITPNNGTARMALFYQDPGGAGPVLSRIGCGGAATPEGHRWWVVMMAP